MDFISSDIHEAEIRLMELTLAPDFQVRSLVQSPHHRLQVIDGVVQEYRELLEDGVDLGPLEVVEEVVITPDTPLKDCPTTGRLILVDGFHRWAAHRRLGREMVRCRIRRGDELTALLLAAQSNAARGLRYTHADKVKIIEMFLAALAERQITWSDVQLARHVGVHRRTVAKVRENISSRLNIPKERQVLRNGTSYTITPPQSAGYIPDEDLDGLPGSDETIPWPRSKTSRPSHSRQQPPGRQQSASSERKPPPTYLGRRSDERIIEPDRSRELSTTLGSPQALSDHLPFLDTLDLNTDGLGFALSWREIHAGQVRTQGVANQRTPASRLPEYVRVGLRRWLEEE